MPDGHFSMNACDYLNYKKYQILLKYLNTTKKIRLTIFDAFILEFLQFLSNLFEFLEKAKVKLVMDKNEIKF